MSNLLRTRPASTPAMLAAFGDAALIRHALAFEAALAQAQADEGLIAADAAVAIEAACGRLVIDPVELAEEVALAGTLAIPLVSRLRAELPHGVAGLVHMAATSQDVADTALMLQARTGTALLVADVARTMSALRVLARRHAAHPAVGRTLLQDALPVGFGLRIAQWLSGIDEAARQLRDQVALFARLQLGGAAGTRAAMDGRGASVAARMATTLGLADGAPWHNQRVGVAAIAAALGLLIGTLGKMARDVSLLAQNAVGEAREPAIQGRGGSSAMVHKRNPTGAQVALSAAIRAPGLVGAILAGLPAEQERGLGGWQAEAPVLAELFLLAAGAADASAVVAEGLEIDGDAIARNLAGAAIGGDIGESEAIVAAILDRQERR